MGGGLQWRHDPPRFGDEARLTECRELFVAQADRSRSDVFPECANLEVPAIGSITGLRASIIVNAIWLGVRLCDLAILSGNGLVMERRSMFKVPVNAPSP